jgi:hypothetical protein
MEIGSPTTGTVAESNQQLITRQAESQARQANLETSDSQSVPENRPTPDSRVGSVINTQA